MSQTTLVNNISRSDEFPISQTISAENNCGMISLVLGNTWTEQMICELPTINISVFVENDIKVASLDIDMTTVNNFTIKTSPIEPYTIPIYNMPKSCTFKITPLFDKYAITSHNSQIETGNIEMFNTSVIGIVDTDILNYSSEIWTTETQIFDITIVFDDSNIVSGGGGSGGGTSITIDTQVEQGSTNPVQNGAIYDFVNSSVSTNTAYFIGTFNSLSDLENYSGTVSNNDYAFVISTDTDGNTVYNRYKYNSDAETWNFEYSLNNSSFTAAEWETIQSGLTTQDKTNFTNHIANKNNPHDVTKSQIGLGNVDNTSDLNKPISNATQIALNGKQDNITFNFIEGTGIDLSGDTNIQTNGSMTISISDIDGMTDNISEDLYTITYNAQGQITSANQVTSFTLNCTSDGLDGTPETYFNAMKAFFNKNDADNVTPQQLTDLCTQWYINTRDNWNGWTTFANTGVSTGTRGGDNTGLTCVPSTNTVAGQDDFAGLPLFYPIDVNYEIDASTKDIIITGIDGITSNFERTNPDKFVGVMQMSGYVWHSEDSINNTFTDGYSSRYYEGADECNILPEAVRLDGTYREFVVHVKYMGKVVDNKIKSYSGVIPTSYSISHNTINTYGSNNGPQYSGGSITLLSFLQIMTRIKYASLTQDGIIQGCVQYNYQYAAQVAETGVNRILITPTQAANLVVGSGVLLGTVGSNNSIDRSTASVYNISTQTGCKITNIENVTINDTTYAAVYVDTPNTFNTIGNGTVTTGNTVISTFSWPTGSCNNVLGNDGSPASPNTGKYPAMIQGIEYSTGTYEVFGDIILQAHPANTTYTLGYYTFHVCKDASKRSTSVTSNYETLPNVLPYNTSTSAAWRYITKITFSNGIAVPTNTLNGSSTTFTRDAWYYLATPSTVTTREWLSFGSLSPGSAGGGLSYVLGYNALSNAYWSIGGRASCGEAFRA